MDIRVIVVDKTVMAATIFSQNNPKTELDFRNYDRSRPNRLAVHSLSQEIEDKVISLSVALRLNFMSLDLLYYLGEYYFIDLNATGQVDWVIKSCNYNLEKIIYEFFYS